MPCSVHAILWHSYHLSQLPDTSINRHESKVLSLCGVDPRWRHCYLVGPLHMLPTTAWGTIMWHMASVHPQDYAIVTTSNFRTNLLSTPNPSYSWGWLQSHTTQPTMTLNSWPSYIHLPNARTICLCYHDRPFLFAFLDCLERLHWVSGLHHLGLSFLPDGKSRQST